MPAGFLPGPLKRQAPKEARGTVPDNDKSAEGQPARECECECEREREPEAKKPGALEILRGVLGR